MTFKLRNDVRNCLLAPTFALLFTAAGPTQAESACKGLSQGACGSKDSCTWVDSYTTKKGVKVSAYCRTKSGQSKAGGGAKKSETSKSSDKTDKKTDKKTKSSS